ncbi:hypothetical protein A5790_20900 [Mycobacterium sp. 852002-51152_SCH6134967]|nr:hypothetical protein A5790_20900 [Mycobacterium sp. 852002-51152_SCH6134967]
MKSDLMALRDQAPCDVGAFCHLLPQYEERCFYFKLREDVQDFWRAVRVGTIVEGQRDMTRPASPG